MKRWFADTLFKRLFALMWLALVLSHLAAFLLVTQGMGPSGTALQHLPTLPSLPPMGSPMGSPDEGGFDEPDWEGMPTRLRLLDYGVRMVVIALAAWWGAGWLARPMSRLASASRGLADSLARQQSPAPLDENSGTAEVRAASRVFNEMARQLDANARSRGLMMAAISHDLRTPLTRIRMRLETSAETDPLAARSIADVREMDALIESSLALFRGADATEPAQATDVHALAQSLVDDLAELGEPVSLAGEAAVAKVQPAALRRALANLVGNALRHAGRADVLVAHDEAGRVQVHVDDRGPGIPPAMLDAVMQPFVRLDRSRSRETGGSGLGLYIARDLLERQGAQLALHNRTEGGLRATITLAAG